MGTETQRAGPDMTSDQNENTKPTPDPTPSEDVAAADAPEDSPAEVAPDAAPEDTAPIPEPGEQPAEPEATPVPGRRLATHETIAEGDHCIDDDGIDGVAASTSVGTLVGESYWKDWKWYRPGEAVVPEGYELVVRPDADAVGEPYCADWLWLQHTDYTWVPTGCASIANARYKASNTDVYCKPTAS